MINMTRLLKRVAGVEESQLKFQSILEALEHRLASLEEVKPEPEAKASTLSGHRQSKKV